MYAFIEGEVCEKVNGGLVLLAAGVGWQLNCSNNTLQAAPPLGEKMRCWTYLSVREDAMELFGFATREEKEMFLQLTSVSGIGKKTAQRIALELKDKISQADVSAAVPAQSAAAPALSPDAVTEAIEAMIALGYSSTEARNAISQVRDQTDKPEELIRLALRAMAGF